MFSCPGDGFIQNILLNFFICFVKAGDEVINVHFLHVGVGRKYWIVCNWSTFIYFNADRTYLRALLNLLYVVSHGKWIHFFRRAFCETFCAWVSQYSNFCLLLKDTLQLQVLFKVGMYERMGVGVEMEIMKWSCSFWRRYSGICKTVIFTSDNHDLILVKPTTGADDWINLLEASVWLGMWVPFDKNTFILLCSYCSHKNKCTYPQLLRRIEYILLSYWSFQKTVPLYEFCILLTSYF
jgi:hypothetical protein